MARQPAFSRLRMRLVSDQVAERMARRAGRSRVIYRPLAIGAAVVARPGWAGGRWVVPVAEAGLIRPRGPQSISAAISRARSLVAAGTPARVAVTLLAPEDLVSDRRGGVISDLGGLRHDGYGWSLLYQVPGMRGMACVDAHDRFADLPAFYESPLEYLDRAAFLAERGIRSRPLALVAQPEDFRLGCDGRVLNRFYPDGSFAADAGPCG